MTGQVAAWTTGTQRLRETKGKCGVKGRARRGGEGWGPPGAANPVGPGAANPVGLQWGRPSRRAPLARLRVRKLLGRPLAEAETGERESESRVGRGSSQHFPTPLGGPHRNAPDCACLRPRPTRPGAPQTLEQTLGRGCDCSPGPGRVVKATASLGWAPSHGAPLHPALFRNPVSPGTPPPPREALGVRDLLRAQDWEGPCLSGTGGAPGVLHSTAWGSRPLRCTTVPGGRPRRQPGGDAGELTGLDTGHTHPLDSFVAAQPRPAQARRPPLCFPPRAHP